MPISVTSSTYSDEFITSPASTTDLNALVGDIITATHNVFYENIVDAGASGSYKLSVADGSNVLPSIPAQYDSNICVILNDALKSFTGNTRLQEFFGNEVTTTNFSTNYTGNVIAILNSGSNRVLVLDTTGSQSLDQENNATVYYSGTIGSCSIDYQFNEQQNISIPALKLAGGQNANFSTTSNTLDAGSASVITVPFKYQGAYQTGSLTISGVAQTTTRQSFEIIHTFRATPISVTNDFTLGVLPQLVPNSAFVDTNDYQTDTLFDSGGEGHYKLDINFLETPADTNPLNVLIQETSGTVNVFGNSIRGGATNYSVSNLAIVRTSDSAVSGVPIVQEKFTVTFLVDNTADTPFSDTNTLVKVGVENIPVDILNTENYEQTFLSDYALQTLGAGAIAGSATGDALSISAYTATFVSSSQISISFDVEFTAGAITQINLNVTPYFTIFVETQDHLLNYTNSDRTVLEVFSGEGIQAILSDPITVNSSQFITSPFQDFSTGIDASEIDGFPVQLMVGSTQFSADWTGRTDLRINEITQRLVLKNTSTLEEIELDGTIIPVNSFPLIDSEYPDANYSVQKGFKIPSTEVRNLIRMINISDALNVRTFEVFFPFFIRWEDYTELILTSIPSSILDASEPFDGKNFNVNRIDDLSDWELDYRITFDCNEGGQLFSQDFDLVISTSGYDEHPDVTTRVINSFKEDGVTSLTDAGTKYIESTEKTLIVGEWTFSSAPSVISDFEIEFYIEAFENGSPTKIQRISSVNNLLSGSWFTDTGAGDGKVLKSIDGSKAVGKAFINNSTLVGFDKYRIYGTIYDPTRPTEFILTEGGDNLVSEAGDKFIRDF